MIPVLQLLFFLILAAVFGAVPEARGQAVNLRALGGIDLSGADVIDAPTASVRMDIVAAPAIITGLTSPFGAAMPPVGSALGFRNVYGQLAPGRLDFAGNLLVGVAAGSSLAANQSVQQRQAGSGAVLADLAVTTTSQVLVASSATRLGIICWNQGASPNAIRVGFGATPTATSGYFWQWTTGWTDTGTYQISVIRDTGATANPTVSCSTVSQ